ncbi:hypothetical protein [Rhodococcoides fascians]|uniref:hypothetical protein n=1 Tax=Rhodococcoides fascians TaxID=1828 RepID=UPI000565302D|nr:MULTISPECIES: hypothetical protein [Rhodococcus]OZF00553.1 hypothetical protein CH301_12795 [Rhodococcus sp. 15-1189-1-1a]OZF14432.1 hypothetical protein CH299_13475 [Rhodococcus sp. 14-2686-1-2]
MTAHELWPIELEEAPSLSTILEFVAPMILETRDNGHGKLEHLPRAGTPEWVASSDRVKWAAIAVLALEACWSSERGPTERIAYSEGVARVAAEMNWGAYGYETGYEKGRRDQKALDRRIDRNRQNRGVAA